MEKRKSLKAMAAAVIAATFAHCEKQPWFITLSKGNRKLRPTKKIKYLIFNLPAQVTCPFATPHCKKYCYAKKAEKCYKQTLPARKRNFERAQTIAFTVDMILTITAYINTPSYRAADKIIVRIHESGDFFSRAYVKAWLKIARWFLYDDRIMFMAYTKSIDYFIGLKVPANMIVRFSLWDDTPIGQFTKAKELNWPIYTAVERFTNEKEITRCHCIDCSTCQKCFTDIPVLRCEIH